MLGFACGNVFQVILVAPKVFIAVFGKHVDGLASPAGNHEYGIGFLGDVYVGAFAGPGEKISTGRQVGHGRNLHPSISKVTIVDIYDSIYRLGIDPASLFDYLGRMRGTQTRGICEIHNRPFPCLSCRGAKGGRVSSPKKSAANRAKARHAAMSRWHRKENEHAGV